MKLEDDVLSQQASLQRGGGRPLLVHHVARLTGYSPRTIRYLAQTGELPGFKLGKKIWGFARADILKQWGRP